MAIEVQCRYWEGQWRCVGLVPGVRAPLPEGPHWRRGQQGPLQGAPGPLHTATCAERVFCGGRVFCAGRLLCAALLMAEVRGIVGPTGGVLGRRGGGAGSLQGPQDAALDHSGLPGRLRPWALSSTGCLLAAHL